MQVTCTLQTCEIHSAGQKGKDKDNMVVKIISMFRTAVHFFSTCQALKAWFELSRINLDRNDLKGIKNYFE